MRFPIPLFAVALSLAAASAGAAVVTQDAEGRYPGHAGRALGANAPNVDWGQLRLAYAERPGFKVFAQNPARRQMLQAANAANCKDALPAAQAVIAEDYVDADAHFVAAYCEDGAGDTSVSRLDRDIAIGLIKSIQTGAMGLLARRRVHPDQRSTRNTLMRKSCAGAEGGEPGA